MLGNDEVLGARSVGPEPQVGRFVVDQNRDISMYLGKAAVLAVDIGCVAELGVV